MPMVLFYDGYLQSDISEYLGQMHMFLNFEGENHRRRVRPYALRKMCCTLPRKGIDDAVRKMMMAASVEGPTAPAQNIPSDMRIGLAIILY
jgi:hypothetical protein